MCIGLEMIRNSLWIYWEIVIDRTSQFLARVKRFGGAVNISEKLSNYL